MTAAFNSLKAQVQAAEVIIDKAEALAKAVVTPETSDAELAALGADLQTHIDAYNTAADATPAAPATPAA